MHSSRMRPARSLSASRSMGGRGVCVPGGHACRGACMPGGVVHARGCACPGVCVPGGVWPGKAYWDKPSPRTEFLTHAWENITFPQLLLRAVIKHKTTDNTLGIREQNCRQSYLNYFSWYIFQMKWVRHKMSCKNQKSFTFSNRMQMTYAWIVSEVLWLI